MDKDNRNFTVVIGDLVKSRKIPLRQEISEKLRTAISDISGQFDEEFYAPLILTKGMDELSGVLKRLKMSYRICESLNDRITPYLFRFAVVKGTLDVGIHTRDARQMDGSAFHKASDLIQLSKEKNLYYYFDLSLQYSQFSEVVTELANLIHIVKSDWSSHQMDAVRLYEKFKKQKLVAEKLDITQQAVSEALKKAHWKELKRAEKTIEKILSFKR